MSENKDTFVLDLNNEEIQKRRRDNINKLMSYPASLYVYKDGKYIEVV